MTELFHWTRKSQKIVTANNRLTLIAEDYELPDQREIKDFYVVLESDGVNVIAITQDWRIPVIRQFRPAVQEIVYDFPGGFIEAHDANPLERAKAELFEEAGFRSSIWHSTGVLHTAPHRLRKKEHTFLALNAEFVGVNSPDENEALTYELVDYNAVWDMIRTGVFACSVCCASFIRAEATLRHLGLCPTPNCNS